jgi:hypothetical protein
MLRTARAPLTRSRLSSRTHYAADVLAGVCICGPVPVSG